MFPKEPGLRRAAVCFGLTLGRAAHHLHSGAHHNAAAMAQLVTHVNSRRKIHASQEIRKP